MRRSPANTAAATPAPAPRPSKRQPLVRAKSTLPDGVRCAVCGLADPVWLRVAHFATERAVLCLDAECRQRWEASRPAMLLETLAILTANRGHRPQ